MSGERAPGLRASCVGSTGPGVPEGAGRGWGGVLRRPPAGWPGGRVQGLTDRWTDGAPAARRSLGAEVGAAEEGKSGSPELRGGVPCCAPLSPQPPKAPEL